MFLSRTTKPRNPIFSHDFLNRDWEDWTSLDYDNEGNSIPKVNITESKKVFRIKMAIPGVDKKDIGIQISKQKIIVTARIEEVKEDAVYSRREFNHRSFQREFYYPEELIDFDGIEAKYADGILHILLPKKEKEEPKPSRKIIVE